MKRILRTPKAAEYLGISESWLEKKRLEGGGPPYIKLGHRAVGYDIDDLDRWLESRRVASTSDAVRLATKSMDGLRDGR